MAHDCINDFLENMSNKKYLGEIEFISAITSIRKQLTQVPSFVEALPCSADASYINEESVTVPAVVRIKPVSNKHQPDTAFYKVRLDATLPGYGLEANLAFGTQDEILAWLDQCTDHDKVFKLLFDTYRGAWESVDSVRFRDY